MEGCIPTRVGTGTNLIPAEASTKLHDSQGKHACLAFWVVGAFSLFVCFLKPHAGLSSRAGLGEGGALRRGGC